MTGATAFKVLTSLFLAWACAATVYSVCSARGRRVLEALAYGCFILLVLAGAAYEVIS